ncbi:MAG: hypothetical protein HYV96_19090 [Opitutae bacterium]|nr:hypothetical protein [Opitutae bacterium]
MSQRPQNSKITVEDLLRLKRAERPDAEFWSKFEVELRQKQLAALVERRPWWQSLPILLSRRVYLPVGATAVLAFTVVSLRYASTPVANIAPAQQASEAVASPVSEPSRDIVASVESSQPRAENLALAEAPQVAAPVQLSDSLPAQNELTPWSAPRAQETPSARSIAANLARFEESEPDLANALLSGSRIPSAPSEAQEVASHAAEFAGVAAVSSRRNRLLAAMTDRQFTQDPSAPEVVRERLARRLGDTDYGNGWTRVGLKADRVSLKF